MLGTCLDQGFSEPDTAVLVKAGEAAFEIESVLGSGVLRFEEELDLWPQVGDAITCPQAAFEGPGDVGGALIEPPLFAHVIEAR